MPIKFKSQATGDLVMVQAHAQALLKVIGKGDASKGILEPADMDTALQALRALSDEAPGCSGPEGAKDTEEVKIPPFQDEAVSLRKRAWPLVKMIEQARGAGKPIVWGV